jgi:hypothetical protein
MKMKIAEEVVKLIDSFFIWVFYRRLFYDGRLTIYQPRPDLPQLKVVE